MSGTCMLMNTWMFLFHRKCFYRQVLFFFPWFLFHWTYFRARVKTSWGSFSGLVKICFKAKLLLCIVSPLCMRKSCQFSFQLKLTLIDSETGDLNHECMFLSPCLTHNIYSGGVRERERRKPPSLCWNELQFIRKIGREKEKEGSFLDARLISCLNLLFTL